MSQRLRILLASLSLFVVCNAAVAGEAVDLTGVWTARGGRVPPTLAMASPEGQHVSMRMHVSRHS